MKAFNVIIKILAALAAIAGIIYVVATYGEQIVAWAKKIMASLPKCPCCKEDVIEEEAAEEVIAEETPAEEEAVEVTIEVAEEVSESDAVAEEVDFEA